MEAGTSPERNADSWDGKLTHDAISTAKRRAGVKGSGQAELGVDVGGAGPDRLECLLAAAHLAAEVGLGG